MNIKEFDKKYTSKGGIEKLANMRALLMPLKSIGSHFGVSRERVRQWMIEFFGEKYDVRPHRRIAKEKSMDELKSNTETII